MIFHHIGIAVADDVHPEEILGGLFPEVITYPPVFDKHRKVLLLVCECCGIKHEFVYGEMTRVVLGNRRAVPYHLCYEVEDMQKAITYAEAHGWVLWRAPAPAVLWGDRMVVFMMHKDFGLVELLEAPTEPKHD